MVYVFCVSNKDLKLVFIVVILKGKLYFKKTYKYMFKVTHFIKAHQYTPPIKDSKPMGRIIIIASYDYLLSRFFEKIPHPGDKASLDRCG